MSEIEEKDDEYDSGTEYDSSSDSVYDQEALDAYD